MTCNYKVIRNAALSFVMAGGMAGFATFAYAHSYSQSEVRDAQQQLKDDGYYTGKIDGVNGQMTMDAIRNFQRDNNLNVTGQLDRQTADKLGIQSEANREATESQSNQSNQSNEAAPQSNYSNQTYSNEANRETGVTPSQTTVKAAQQKLHQSGFYSGNIDGMYGAKTRAAVREFQQNSNLNPTGQLDQETLSKLGVSK
ncbi:MAG TPA: peptidoglycan-binding domain-containing protein [Bryobacteraceae bacterium]|nr:peptidoglycan-binding domain-containing protein [Bryobacteraceae bacterium]